MSRLLLVGVFEKEDDILSVTRAAKDQGLSIVDVYAPYAVHGLERALGLKASKISVVCLLAGIAGALMYLAPASGMHIHVAEVLAEQGFNGIAVALLGMSNPLGIIFTGLFIAHITVGGSYLQSLRYMKEIIEVIIGLIIYFSAFSLLVRDVIARAGKRRARKTRLLAAREGQDNLSIQKEVDG